MLPTEMSEAGYTRNDRSGTDVGNYVMIWLMVQYVAFVFPSTITHGIIDCIMRLSCLYGQPSDVADDTYIEYTRNYVADVSLRLPHNDESASICS